MRQKKLLKQLSVLLLFCYLRQMQMVRRLLLKLLQNPRRRCSSGREAVVAANVESVETPIEEAAVGTGESVDAGEEAPAVEYVAVEDIAPEKPSEEALAEEASIAEAAAIGGAVAERGSVEGAEEAEAVLPEDSSTECAPLMIRLLFAWSR